jgi:hypothetical protein
MEAQGFVSKFQRLGKMGRSDSIGVDRDDVERVGAMVPDKSLKLKSLVP